MFSSPVRSVMHLLNPVVRSIARRSFRTINTIQFPTTVLSDCTIDKDWLHQHFPTAVGVAVADSTGKWQDVDVLSGATDSVKKGTTICIFTDDGIRTPLATAQMALITPSGRAQKALQSYMQKHPDIPLGIYYLVEVTHTETGAWCCVVGHPI